MSIRSCFGFIGFVVCFGCGGASKPAATPDAENGARSEVAASSDKKNDDDQQEHASAKDEKVPSSCALKDPCRPPAKWVDNLCHDVHPGLGVYLFQTSLPWEKRYLTRKTEAVNASGGATREGWLEFDEEVLILKLRKAPAGGMQVSGASESYDALRWDGSCVTLSGEEVTANAPPSPKHAFVTWRFLDDCIQEALKEDEKIREVYRQRTKECKGQNQGEVSKGCVKADKDLSALVVGFVRRGGKIPLPTKLPD